MVVFHTSRYCYLINHDQILVNLKYCSILSIFGVNYIISVCIHTDAILVLEQLIKQQEYDKHGNIICWNILVGIVSLKLREYRNWKPTYEGNVYHNIDIIMAYRCIIIIDFPQCRFDSNFGLAIPTLCTYMLVWKRRNSLRTFYLFGFHGNILRWILIDVGCLGGVWPDYQTPSEQSSYPELMYVYVNIDVYAGRRSGSSI